MYDVKHKLCEFKECNIRANYNIKGEKSKFCVTHKTEDMIDVNNDSCKFKECTNRPSYNIKDSIKGEFCNKHKQINMINIYKKKCYFKGCTKVPHFNIKGMTKGKYCVKHKTSKMYDIFHKTCIYNGCYTRPSYNILGKKTGKYCVKHKTSDMINVIDKKCKYEGCNIRPNYNTKGEKKGKYCISHKHNNMVNVKNKICIYDGCKVQANYNIKGETKCKYCVIHKTSDMIDVKKKTCEYEKCDTGSSYGLPGKKPTRCAKHYIKNMIKNSRKKCIIEKCNEIALYGISKQERCESHKLKDDYNLIEKECKSCNLPEILDHDNLCRLCNPKHFKTIRLVKQNEVKHFFDCNDIKYELSDKIIDKGVCGRERPDFLISLPTHYIVVEVDENQHCSTNYKSCEIPRMINISQSLGMPTVFIRYNPDNYKIKKILQKTNKNIKLKKLKEWIKYISDFDFNDIRTNGYLSCVFLFYNEYDSSTNKIKTILDFHMK